MDIVSNMKLNTLEDDQPSRPKSKLRFIMYFIIIVGATISAFQIWKSRLQNPSTAAQVACSVTFDRHICFTSISSLQRNSSNYSSTSNPAKIFALSLQVGINELNKMTPFLETLISNAKSEWTLKALRNCEDGFDDSRKILNMTLALIGDDPNENYLREMNISSYLKEKILDARENIDKCRSRLSLTELYDEYKTKNEVERKMKEAWGYVDNSLRIFFNMDEIHEKLNPTIGSITDSNYLTTTAVLGLAPFFFLAILIFLVVKSMKYEPQSTFS